MGTSVFSTVPKLASGRMALTRKLGFSFSTKSQSAFSDSALLALYTAVGALAGKGAEVTDQASAMAASFQVVVVMVEGELSGVGLVMATELEVRTKDLTEGERDAERRRVVTPRMVWGMTAAGSGLKDMTEAEWMMPWTPGEVSGVQRQTRGYSTLDGIVECALNGHIRHYYGGVFSRPMALGE